MSSATARGHHRDPPRRHRTGRPDRVCAARSPSPRSPMTAGRSPPAPTSTRSPTASSGTTSRRDGRLEPPSAAPPVRAAAPTAGPAGAAISATTTLAARRAAIGPVRAGLGPADGRVRGRATLVEALHPGLGPVRAPGAGPGPPRPRRDPGLARRDRGLAAADPRRPGAARLVSRGAVQRAVLPRRRRHVLGGRARSASRSRRATIRATSPCSSASTTRSTTRSTSTSTPRSRCSPCIPSWSCAASATCSRRSPTTTREIVTIEASGLTAPRKVGGTVPARCRRPATTTRSTGPNWYRFQDVNDWKDLGPEVRAAGLARRASPPAAGAGDALIRDAFPTVERGAAADWPRATATATACPSTTACPTRRTTPGRCTGRRPTAARCGWRPPLAAEAMARRLGDTEAERRVGRLVRARPGRLRPAPVARRPLRLRRRRRPELRQRHGRPAGRPVVRRRDRSRRDLLPPDRVEAALRTVHARNVRGFGGGRMGAVNGTRPDGSVDGSQRAVGRGLGRHDLRAGGVHDRTRAGRGGLGDRRGRGGRDLRARAVVPDAGGVRRATRDFRASIYLRPLAIWAIEEALRGDGRPSRAAAQRLRSIPAEASTRP